MQPLLGCLVLTGIHGLFVMAEYSIVKTSTVNRAGGARAENSRELSLIHEQLEDYLLVSQIGKTAALLSMGILLGYSLSDSSLVQMVPGTDSFLTILGQFVLVFIVIGLTQLVLGQEVPKR